MNSNVCSTAKVTKCCSVLLRSNTLLRLVTFSEEQTLEKMTFFCLTLVLISITDSGPRSENETTYYDITEIFEMGKMASLFFNKTGRIAFYLCLTIYLYGDLAIYGAAVAKSLRFVNAHC